MPNVKHLGCYFHYIQCVCRKIQTLGLVFQYKTNPQIQRIVRKIFALPFLPPNTVTSLFQGFSTTSDVERILLIRFEQFFDYVERQWIFGTNIDIWNVYHREGPTRTTNICEGWNSNWKHQLGKNSKNIWGVIPALKIQEKNQKVKFRKVEQGETAPIQRKRFRDFNKKISEVEGCLGMWIH